MAGVVWVRTTEGDVTALASKAAYLRECAHEHWAEARARTRQAAEVARADVNGALALLSKQRRDLRAAGAYVDSASALVIVYLRRFLADQGWDKRWRLLPEGVASLQGRRPGSYSNPARDWTARVCLTLPPQLHDQLGRAAHHQGLTIADVLRPVISTAVADWRPTTGPWPPTTATGDHSPEWAPLPHLPVRLPEPAQRAQRARRRPTG